MPLLTPLFYDSVLIMLKDISYILDNDEPRTGKRARDYSSAVKHGLHSEGLLKSNLWHLQVGLAKGLTRPRRAAASQCW